ncbi:MAG: OsmC family protein [Ignavibacteria bacterium]|nr:OsmC family protein [Ignavibacteria bacterium]
MTDAPHKVTVKNSIGYKTYAASRGHEIVCDEPEDANGTDTGMTPYELLLASIGACKAITMRMYAERKGFPLEDVELEMFHKKVPAEELNGIKTESGKVDKIFIRTRLNGELTDEQKDRILEIGERCPVQKTVLSEVLIETERVESISL